MTVAEWIEQYHNRSGERFETFKRALEALNNHERHLIVETGCVRLKDDWGAGMSTFLFGDYIANFSGHLWSVDIDATNVNTCKEITKEYAENITYVVNDSIAFLEAFNQEIDLLYLDSKDCPEYDADDSPNLVASQEHQLNEFKTAQSKLAPNAIVLLDDNGFKNGGKTRLTKPYLKEHGWTEVGEGQQSLWMKL